MPPHAHPLEQPIFSESERSKTSKALMCKDLKKTHSANSQIVRTQDMNLKLQNPRLAWVLGETFCGPDGRTQAVFY